MREWLESSIHTLLALLALPEIGLSAIFVVSLVSATLLPLGSEPAVFGYVTLKPSMFWAAVLVATVGNTIGGVISYWMGRVAHRGVETVRARRAAAHVVDEAVEAVVAGELAPTDAASAAAVARARARAGLAAPPEPPDVPEEGLSRRDRWHARAHAWLDRFGPKVLLLSWLPLVGDPLCAVAGWLRLAFWPSVLYMAIGKFARYTTMTAALVWVFPHA